MHLSTLFTTLVLSWTASGATLTQVSNYGGSASKAGMYVYKPDTVSSDALVVVIHSCQSTAQTYFQNSKIPWKQGSDKKGYVTVWPSSPNSGTCWDVSSKASLTHNGGGDSNAIANMITYAIKQYNIDPKKVYVTGGSSGAMMSNVLAATYPDMISAVSLYSGVPAGCFSGAGVDQWSNACANGQLTKTAEAWGDQARAMYAGYNGTRPKMQIWHGSADTTLHPPNYNETIKQWTNVLGVSDMPTNSTPNDPEARYTTYSFGDQLQGIYAQGVGHSVPSHLSASEAWFGL